MNVTSFEKVNNLKLLMNAKFDLYIQLLVPVYLGVQYHEFRVQELGFQYRTKR
jgi:hypothetical protein